MSLIRPLASLGFASILLAGCHVSTHKDGHKDNVDIGTPFGSMQVKTNDGADTAAMGIAAYPGAVPDKEDRKDGNSADINMNFGSFHLGVKAGSYLSPDPQDKIIAFYRKDLARYGEVITCKGHSAVGQPARTSQGLTCDSDHGGHVNSADGDSGSHLELRAGSQQHQHIVGVEAKGTQTKIGLVSLDLPTHMGSHEDKDSE